MVTKTQNVKERPKVLPVLPDNIPAALKALRQWVCWRLEFRGKKWTKIPVNPHTGGNAESDAPASWGTFAETLAYHQSHPDTTDGIGYVFSPDDPFAGVDFDDCLDVETGELTAWGRDLVQMLDSYTEDSPSGTGVKVWVRGKKPGDRCRKAYQGGEVEIYDRVRYFAVTGHR